MATDGRCWTAATAPETAGERSTTARVRGRSWTSDHGPGPHQGALRSRATRCQSLNSVLSGSPRKLGTVHIDAIFKAIGTVVVRFRWVMLLIWVVGAIAAVSLLPSLNNVTQNNNSKFLPASAPSEHAAQLAAPFGTASYFPIPVVAAR